MFDRNKNWSEAFRDDQYEDDSYGAAFARDGRLATTSFDGLIRPYQYDPNSDSPNFRRVGEPLKAPSGERPRGVAYSPDGKLLALGYYDVAAVDVFDGTTLERVGGHKPAGVEATQFGPYLVAWSRDGLTLFAAGGVEDTQVRTLLFAWDRGGLGEERRMTYCAANTAAGVNALPDGRILVAGMTPCLGLMNADGHRVWTIASRAFDFRGQEDTLKASVDGSLVDFVYVDPTSNDTTPAAKLRFDLRSLTLSSPPPNDGLTFAPLREGLTIDGWRDGTNPMLNARSIPFDRYDTALSVAIAPDAKRFFLGSSYALTAFDDAGTPRWRLNSTKRCLGRQRQQEWTDCRHGRQRRGDPVGIAPTTDANC